MNRHTREVKDLAHGTNLGLGLRRPCRGQSRGGILEAMARI